ncbi:MAG: LacI family DNA-binding transcriptional regulator [Actinomycetaceae bacterium]|nr:LacI family DNA-binding transcriptional regulator [Actinomycetaceae bacterium]
MTVTISDVAKRAGVSSAAVSMVLSGQYKGRVSAKRAEVIQKAAKELGYVGNSLAGSLRTKKTNTLGFISDVVASTPYAYAMVAAANRRANELGYLLLISETGGDPKATQDVFSTLMAQQVSAIAYASMYHQAITLPEFRPKNLVVLDGYATDEDVISVVPDEVGGAKTAINHLIELGHRKIGFINDRYSVDAGPMRLEGYYKALAEAGIEYRDEYVVHSLIENPEVDAAAHELLTLPDRPTAIFCFNDATAAGVYRAARRLGLSIPDDVSVVGFDNFLPIATNLEPQLTTMQLPHEQMATWVIDHLVKNLESPAEEIEQRRIQFDCPLVQRGSTKAI